MKFLSRVYTFLLAFAVLQRCLVANKPTLNGAKTSKHINPSPGWCSSFGGDKTDEVFVYTVTTEQRQSLLSSYPEKFEENFDKLIIQQIRDTFNKKGYVIIRGLIDDNLLQRLETASEILADRNSQEKRQSKEFVSFQFGPIFSGFDQKDEESEVLTAFYDAATSSAIPQFISKILLPKDGGKNNKKVESTTTNTAVAENGRSLRVLKDALLCKGKEAEYCGWHVDDWVFWPTSAKSLPGINAWIALDDIPSKFGGGIAISPGSHLANWRHDAYQAIGSTQIHPDQEGLVLGSKLSKKGVLNTCKMADLAPEIAETMEETKVVFDYQKGDILFHTRWLFHRSDPVNNEGQSYYKTALKRYSIRYEFGSTNLQKGTSIEPCILLNPDNSGQSLDEVCEVNGPWYPRCISDSQFIDAEKVALQNLVDEKLPLVDAKRKEVFARIAPYIQASG